MSGGHYNWSSPLIVNGFAYIGIASLGDCPLVQGQLLKVNLSTHQVVGTLDLVPSGQVGAGIWTSPAYDATRNEIFAVTGTEQSDAQTNAQAVVGIDASSMTVVDDWHLPESAAVADSDWTTSTGLYTAANGTPMLVTTNKNGYTYAFNRTNLAAGPVWRIRPRSAASVRPVASARYRVRRSRRASCSRPRRRSRPSTEWATAGPFRRSTRIPAPLSGSIPKPGR